MGITAIILAGGLGTRMGDLCELVPKSMLVFNKKPFLDYLISWLSNNGVNEIILSTGHLSDYIQDYFQKECWKNRGVKIVKENVPLGTAGAIKLAATEASNKTIYICNADTLLQCDFQQIYNKAMSIKSPIITIVTRNQNVPNQGAIKIEGTLVTEFKEDGSLKELESNERYYRASSTGCYITSCDFLMSDYFSTGSSLEKQVLPHLVINRLLGAILCKPGYFIDYGTPNMYRFLLNNQRILDEVYGLNQFRYPA